MNAVVMDDSGDRFLQRVHRAADRVLGNSQTGREIGELCRDHAEAREMILTDRVSSSVVVAVVGATGQGKSWLVRQMIRGGPVDAIRSGNSLDEATEKLTWIGPKPPADLDARHERFIACDAGKMRSIGSPYLLVDAPGATDDRRAIAGVAQRALSTASVLVMVVRRDQLRSQRVSGLAAASEGSVVIPVVNMADVHDDSLDADVEALVARLRSTAPQSQIAPAVIVRDFEIDEQGEDEIGIQLAETLGRRIEEAICESGGGDQRRSTRLSALDARFSAAVASVLQTQLPELTNAVDRLNAEATRLPSEVAGTLLGGTTPLRAAIRSRLRLSLMADTAAIWFPYRTVLSLLNLTHGAWDRVLLSLSGSLPSLIGAVYAGARNLNDQRAADMDLRSGLRQRTAASVADRLGPMARRFRAELNQLRHGSIEADLESSPDTPVASLAGIETLQESSQKSFDTAITQGSTTTWFANAAGLAGTLLFWLLMTGPLVALYRGYFDASYSTMRDVLQAEGVAGDLNKFPRPDMSMMLTSLLLSVLPMAVFSMLILSWAQAKGRVDRIESRLRDEHEHLVQKLQRDGVLRLAWSDPLLADAEFLLSVGRTGEEGQ
ncbi:hypothetical protein RISK_001538 [Rhodopirellula islandica]|uniref:Uncharacterized protein n=1 Tax=Rhodopirellula islandica TaxID=595434 RepID=A0A0J1BIF9_RHOIS|nr:hypothetical protein [Rhodopirellula islandica]KLU06327.1 hypothetical protein RISK_001538 [Rhodopirellula islandica]